jgi:hypothetical protein
MGSNVVIRVDGTDITTFVMPEGTKFESSASAIPGTATIICKDIGQDLSFITGREVTLEVDGQLVWGGYLRNVLYQYFFPADHVPDDASQYTKRQFVLQCIDYNVLFDKRVIRNTADYFNSLPTFTIGSAKDGSLLTTLLNNYVDVPSGFDTSSQMDDVAYVGGDLSGTGAYMQQGTKLRDQWAKFALWSSAVWYIRADKKFLWKGLESVVKRWGFSDQPNHATITTATGYQGATRGFRGATATEDGSPLVNDAMVWGGSPLGSGGAVVFDREQDATSEAAHGRWQLGETHFNESGYGVQAGVDARAQAIVFGPPGANALGQQKGLRYNQWDFKFTWFADDVPFLSGVHDHIVPGDLVTIEMNAHGVTKLLPCRSLTISFPSLDQNGDGIAQFDAEFALNVDDPWQLWSFLLSRARIQSTTTIVNVTNGSTVTVFGANFQGVPTPAPNGTQTLFDLPFGYIAGTLDLYINGLLQRPSVDFFETNNVTGQFQTADAPASTDNLYCVCRTLAS